MAPQARCTRVPWAGSRGNMAHAHRQAGGVATRWPRHVPPPRAPAVAPTASGGTQDGRGLGSHAAAPARPPLPPGGPRQGGRIRIAAAADPATVWAHRVDTVGTRVAHTRVHDVMPASPRGRAVGLRRPPAMGNVADPCWWLRIDRDHRRTARLHVLAAGRADRNWRLAVRRRRARVRCAGAWSTVVEGLAPRADGAVAHRMALPAPRLSPPARALTGPAPWCPRGAARRRLPACRHGLQPRRVRRRPWPAPCPLVAPTSAHVDGGGRARQRLVAQPPRAGGPPRRPCAGRHAPVAETEGLGRRPQPPRPFVSLGLARLILGLDRWCVGACNQAGEDHPMTTRWQPIRCVH